jgi:hypothetical protein
MRIVASPEAAALSLAFYINANGKLYKMASEYVKACDQADPFKWLPDASAHSKTTIATKEWMGFLVYKARGYL